jgi:hypothetical protein
MDPSRQDAGDPESLACINCHHPAGPGRRRKPEGKSGGRIGGVGFVRANPIPPSKADCRIGGVGFVRANPASAHGFVLAPSPRKWSDQWVRLLDSPARSATRPQRHGESGRTSGFVCSFLRCDGPLYPTLSINLVRPLVSFAQPSETRIEPSPGDRPGMMWTRVERLHARMPS